MPAFTARRAAALAGNPADPSVDQAMHADNAATEASVRFCPDDVVDSDDDEVFRAAQDMVNEELAAQPQPQLFREGVSTPGVTGAAPVNLSMGDMPSSDAGGTRIRGGPAMAAFGRRSSRVLPKSTPAAQTRVSMCDQDTVADGLAAMIPVAQLPPGMKSVYQGSYARRLSMRPKRHTTEHAWPLINGTPKPGSLRGRKIRVTLPAYTGAYES